MRTTQWLIAAILGLLLTGGAGIHTAPTSEARQALAPTGKLRVGLGLGSPIQLIRDSASGEMKGVGFDLGQELARRMGVPFEPVSYPSIGVLIDGGKSGDWDVAFFLISPARMEDFDFTAPIVELELGYLVPKGSPLSTSADVDRPGIRVGVPEKSTADAILSGALKNATLVRGPGLAAGLEMLKAGNADVFGSNKANLFEMSDQLPGSRVLDGRFGAERGAMAIPKGRDAGIAYAQKFIEDAKSEGLVKAALEKAGARGAVVAPPP
jgi:polar amino acid transport system substrate-binding protein